MNSEPRLYPTARRRHLRFGTASVLLLALTASACGDDGEAPAEDPAAQTDAEEGAEEEGTADPGEDSGEQADTEGSAEGAEDAAEEEDEESSEDEGPASNTTALSHDTTLTEPEISPKSVVANGEGLVVANNMLYQNTITVYDAEEQELVQELSDEISPEEFGVEGYPKSVVGAPVEAVWTDDGEYSYVSQYRLEGLGAEAEDFCEAGDEIAPSAVYRYSADEQDWDQFIEVGRIPKYVELTPDGEHLLVSNWCDHDLSVVDTETGEEAMRIPLNSQPRGIVVMDDNRTAFVTAMFANEVYQVDLETGDSELLLNTGERPRHMVRDEAGENVYLTVAGANELLRLDPEAGEVTDSVETGAEPRTMTISEDGTALYVVNYDEDTISKFDADSLEEIQREPTDHLPIGVTYEASTDSVWVATYGGTLNVYDDSEPE